MQDAKEGDLVQSMTTLTNSRFYSASLNAAVFDGPFRIYFSQTQEAFALNVYFRLQRELTSTFERAKMVAPRLGRNIFIMIYPDESVLLSCFDHRDVMSPVVLDKLNEDPLFGMLAGVSENEVNVLFQKIQRLVDEYSCEYEKSSKEGHLNLIVTEDWTSR
tara:strand:+ start:174164 stop:174646 length:483 start_codon:yes stop_codon:yes gene_type:complete